MDAENIMLKKKLEKKFEVLLDEYHALDQLLKKQIKEEPKIEGEIDTKQKEKIKSKKERLAKLLEGNNQLEKAFKLQKDHIS